MRTQVQAFVVKEDICVAKGAAPANANLGAGGRTQYFIEDGDKAKLTSGSIVIFKMTPSNSYFSSSNGVLRTGDQVLAFPGLTRSEFDRGLGQHMTAQKSALDFVGYGPVSVQLWGQRFVAGIRFFRDVVHGVTLTLEQSKVATLGYDTTEKDLLAEKKTLTTMLSKQLECSPSSTSLGADVFDFPWGGVLSRADLKSTWCGIEVRYK